MNNTPHIGNLNKRAKALGLMITKTTTNHDAYQFGSHLYCLHDPIACIDHINDYTLWGIRAMIEEMENKEWTQ